jgi:hypothetical protein
MKTLQEHTVSFSGLGLLEYSPEAYKNYILNPNNEETSYFNQGSALDCLITEGSHEFAEKFAISSVDTPSGMMGEFVKAYLFAKTTGLTEDECLQLAYDNSGYKLGFEAVIKKFQMPEIQEFVKFSIDSADKTILSEEEWQTVSKMHYMLTTSPTSMELMQSGEDFLLQETHNQVEFHYPYKLKSGKEYTMHGSIDRIIINHHNKVIQPLDLKTTGKSVYSFPSSYIKYAYYRQAAIYMLAVHHMYVDLLQEGYTVNPFLFIVAERACKNMPLTYRVSGQDLYAGAHGGLIDGTNKPVKGFVNLLEELQWHQDNDEWSIKKEIRQNGNIIDLKLLCKNGN